MNSNEILNGQSFLQHENPQKLIFMLHGYGDSAENFIHVANSFDHLDFRANYFALNAPLVIPNYPLCRQWFDLYPNGIYIADAGFKEIKIIQSEILKANQMLKNTINKTIDKYKLSYKDCFLLGFSQGGIMTFEFGNYSSNSLGGLAILSGRIMTEDIVTNNDNSIDRITNPDNLVDVKEAILAAGYKPENTEVTMRASTTNELDKKSAETMIRLLDALEDLDDVQKVYSNAEIPDDILAELN